MFVSHSGPAIDVLYRTVNNHRQIVSNQTSVIDQLSEQLEKLKTSSRKPLRSSSAKPSFDIFGNINSSSNRSTPRPYYSTPPGSPFRMATPDLYSSPFNRSPGHYPYQHYTPTGYGGSRGTSPMSSPMRKQLEEPEEDTREWPSTTPSHVKELRDAMKQRYNDIVILEELESISILISPFLFFCLNEYTELHELLHRRTICILPYRPPL